jgi:hypothetical protein
MEKVVMLSVVFAFIGLPWAAARDRSAVRGIQRTVLMLAVFNVMYAFTIVYVLPRLR